MQSEQQTEYPELVNPEQADAAVEYFSSTAQNKTEHRCIQREMDMIAWDKLNAEVEDAYSDRVRIIGTNLRDGLTEALNYLGYEYRHSSVRVEGNSFFIRCVFYKKENAEWH